MNFINFLWFVKDNSISLGTVIAFIPEVEKAVVEITSSSILNNSYGKREMTKYNITEIQLASRIADKTYQILSRAKAKPLPPEPLEWNFSQDGKRIGGMQGHHKDFNYGEYNVFQRAFVFLHSARRLEYLVYRISSCMPLFECVFTNERNEVTQKVCERAAFYLEESAEERMSIFNDLKWAYDLRSTFLHGQSPSNKQVNPEMLKSISVRVDELLRATLTMIIMFDNSIFEDDIKRNSFLKNLIFGHTAYLLDKEYQKNIEERSTAQLKRNKKK